ncbi:MAG: L,D-transpeptidase family protein [Cytophagales bacterium]|nr:L,D-transpeptidase family protein [Cytophagales bacterium]
MKAIHVILIFIFVQYQALGQTFLKDQKRYPRVRAAIAEKQVGIAETLANKDLAIDDFHLLMVAYKAEDRLLLYAKKGDASAYQFLAEYKICSKSGSPGPKRRQGDYQVPEGFYHIDRFNPASNFHLSVGLNYPNLSDRRKSDFERLGGDIFIHGACVTNGCLPMTDDKIKEIYLYAIHARNNGQEKIPVYVFPFEMTDENIRSYTEEYAENQKLLDFWSNLKPGYDRFHQHKKEVSFTVAKNGDYEF